MICKCLEQIKCLDGIHPSRGGSRSIQLHAAAVGAGCGVAAAFEAPIAGAAKNVASCCIADAKMLIAKLVG